MKTANNGLLRVWALAAVLCLAVVWLLPQPASAEIRRLTTAEIVALMADWSADEHPDIGGDAGLKWLMEFSSDGTWEGVTLGARTTSLPDGEASGEWQAKNHQLCLKITELIDYDTEEPLSGCYAVEIDDRKGLIKLYRPDGSRDWTIARDAFDAVAAVNYVRRAAQVAKSTPEPKPEAVQPETRRAQPPPAVAQPQRRQTQLGTALKRQIELEKAREALARQQVALERQKIELERAKIAQQQAKLQEKLQQAEAAKKAAELAAKKAVEQKASTGTSLIATTPPPSATVSNDDQISDYGQYHALVIGINDYTSLQKLKTAMTDARAVADMLENYYGFKVRLLENPTRSEIINAFDRLREELIETDNLLIYYAGHGWLDKEADRGYWLPRDARPDRRSNWLSVSDITDTLRAVLAKHVMVVADSCYSGTLTRDADPEIRRPDYLARIAEKRARVVLSSGGLEPVVDSGGGRHSVFAKQFLFELFSNDKVLDGTRLYQKVRRGVLLNADQTPQYSDIRKAGHEGGDFLFVRRN